VAKVKDPKAEITREQLKLVLTAIETACQVLLTVKPILDAIIKEARQK